MTSTAIAVLRLLAIAAAFGLVAIAAALTILLYLAQPVAGYPPPPAPPQVCERCPTPRPTPTVVGIPPDPSGVPGPDPSAPADRPTLPPTDTARRMAPRRCGRCGRPISWSPETGGWWCTGCQQLVPGPIIVRPTVERVSGRPERPKAGRRFLDWLRHRGAA